LGLLKEFSTKPWSLPDVCRLLAKIDATGSVSRKVGSGRSFSVRTNDNRAIVADLVMSQEENPGTHRTIREIEKDTRIHRSSVHRIIHKQLSLKCFKKKRAQALSDANKLARLTRAKQLLKQYPKRMVPFIFFTDEKLFTVAPPVNLQNNRLYAPSTTKKRELTAE
jgi:hypothetical protein